MREQIVVMQPRLGKASVLYPVSLSKLGIKERQELELWIERNPEILGSRLLIITTEFSHFDKSNRRLDILALDEDGRLVVIELKRDATGSLADLQAIRYASFFSNTTFEEIVRFRAKYSKVDQDKARRQIRSFVKDEQFSSLSAKPRIILAAGSFQDQELTSCVLWLRSFGVDIRCVELTSYHLGHNKSLLLVPRVIIPLPEAEDYIIRTEKKNVSESGLTSRQRQNLERNSQILEFFRSLMPDRASIQPVVQNYMKLSSGYTGVHYEWWHGKEGGHKWLAVALHFETSSRNLNRSLCEYLQSHRAEIQRKLGGALEFEPRRSHGWAGVTLSKKRADWNSEIAKWGAQKMAALIKIAQPLLDDQMAKN